MEIFSSDEKSFSEVDVIGIAITTCDPNARQNHIALLYKYGEPCAPPRLLHLAAHRDLRDNEPDDKYLWMDLGDSFDEIDRAIICAHVQKISQANNGDAVFYGFDLNGKYIDPETGTFQSSMAAIGLTCSTFILEVMYSCGFELIQRDTWPKSHKPDIKWQQKMIEIFLERPGVPLAFLERQKKNVGNRRYLPEEVAASTQGEIPAARGSVMKPALDIRKRLKGKAKVSN